MSAVAATGQAYLYRHYDETGALLYVGISNHVGRRTDDHAKHSGWFERIAKIDVKRFDSRSEALSAERTAIVAEAPLYNVQHKPKLPAITPIYVTKENITRSVVLRPLYDVARAAEVLGISTRAVKLEIESGALGSFELASVRAGNPKTYITGWQIIDWLETRS